MHSSSKAAHHILCDSINRMRRARPKTHEPRSKRDCHSMSCERLRRRNESRDFPRSGTKQNRNSVSAHSVSESGRWKHAEAITHTHIGKFTDAVQLLRAKTKANTKKNEKRRAAVERAREHPLLHHSAQSHELPASPVLPTGSHRQRVCSTNRFESLSASKCGVMCAKIETGASTASSHRLGIDDVRFEKKNLSWRTECLFAALRCTTPHSKQTVIQFGLWFV